MSIPPLVCSTPPPPDQCDDDKDHDDYELQDGLSQEDDENNDFDFGNYPAYNHFETYTFKQEDISTNNIKDEESLEIVVAADKISVSSEKENEETEVSLGAKDTCEIKFGNDDDFDIEDLNLKLDSESSGSSVKDNSSSDEISKHENPIEVNYLDDPNAKSSECQDENSFIPTIDTEDVSFDQFDSQAAKLETAEKDIFQHQNKDVSDNKNLTNQKALEEIVENSLMEAEVKPVISSASNVLEKKSDDDFDDFQFITPEEKTITNLDIYENPWEDKTAENAEFGNFTANFDNNVEHNLPTAALNQNVSEKYDQDFNNDNDNFGDFDDFQSVTHTETKVTPEDEICDTVPVLNFQSTESEAQIMESLNKVIDSLFKEEIVEPVGEDELKLESLLSETWGHLTETDVRQPYIINWNSSLGQKTLLKALCIDSRNILFGPKWTHNMPKYAANLSSAPLQPQKQSSNTPQTEMPKTEKTNSKPNWADPFSANGQQSCNTENENNVVEPRPTDFDVFEAELSTKSDKIYSTTINVQPIRQINLPDTHIFTPTDSETPRSKTIHYDSVPTALVSQTITDKQGNQTQNVSSQSVCNKQSKDDDDDYWEFQEFKTSPKITTLPEINSQSTQSIEKTHESITIKEPLPKTSMAYQTHLLQPIKIEPAIPTLNWPDPGEVKEEFDAFSDFASTSSWVDSNPNITQKESVKPTNIINHTPENNKQENIPEKEVMNSIDVHTLDDDFDTFQSALPTVNKAIDFKSDSLCHEPSNNLHANNTNYLDYEHSITKESSTKTDTISLESTVKSNENLQHTLGFIMNTPETVNKNVAPISSQLLNMNLLQPMPVSSTVSLTNNQQKSGQILQPLSLESYSQINWPSPGIDLQDLSRFNPVETLHSLKSDLSVSGQSKGSPNHNNKPVVSTQVQEDDVWGEFVSSKPTSQTPQTKKQTTFGDDDEWTDFVSSPSVKPHNGLNTISLNVHTNSNIQKNTNPKFTMKNNQISLDIPTLNYITPKTNNHKSYNDRHFQNL